MDHAAQSQHSLLKFIVYTLKKVQTPHSAMHLLLSSCLSLRYKLFVDVMFIKRNTELVLVYYWTMIIAFSWARLVIV